MIYLVADELHHVCKVGYSTDFRKRIKVLDSGYPFSFTRILQRDGGLMDEELIHDALSGKRLKNEWFHFDNEVEEVFMNHLLHEDDLTRSVRNNLKGWMQVVEIEKATGIPPYKTLALWRGTGRHYTVEDVNKIAAYLTGDGE